MEHKNEIKTWNKYIFYSNNYDGKYLNYNFCTCKKWEICKENGGMWKDLLRKFLKWRKIFLKKKMSLFIWLLIRGRLWHVSEPKSEWHDSCQKLFSNKMTRHNWKICDMTWPNWCFTDLWLWFKFIKMNYAKIGMTRILSSHVTIFSVETCHFVGKLPLTPVT